MGIELFMKMILVFCLLAATAFGAENKHSLESERAHTGSRPQTGSNVAADWSQSTIAQLVTALDSIHYGTRDQAHREIERRLLQNFSQTETELRRQMGGSQVEARARLESLFSRSTINWQALLDLIKGEVASHPVTLSAQRAHADLVARLIQPDENKKAAIINAGFQVITEEGPPELATLVAKRGGMYFQIQYLGQTYATVTRVRRNKEGQFVPMNVDVDVGPLLDPLQRARLGIQVFGNFSTPAATFTNTNQTGFSMSLGSNFVARSADYLIGRLPRHADAIRAARDSVIQGTHRDNGVYQLGPLE